MVVSKQCDFTDPTLRCVAVVLSYMSVSTQRILVHFVADF